MTREQKEQARTQLKDDNTTEDVALSYSSKNVSTRNIFPVTGGHRSRVYISRSRDTVHIIPKRRNDT